MPLDFLDNSFSPRLPIPKSCIEGAEYIIQCIAKNSALAWKPNTTRNPHVWAEFGSGIKFNISKEPNFHMDKKCVGLRSYIFGGGLPDVGCGLILLNKTSSDSNTFNMHLGAVVAREDGYTYISDVSEKGKVQMISNWPVKKITHVSEFRIPGYPTSEYAVGLLYPGK
jgi:hypothetical protein